MCNNPMYFDRIYDPYTGKKYPIPCHHCEGCRIDRRTMWERRITSEYVKYRCAFVTLTYNDYFLPYNEGSTFPTLKFKDLQRYLDNLRHTIKKLPEEMFQNGLSTKKYKTVAVGEYGEKGNRPHWHILFLGLDWKQFKKQIVEAWREQGIVDVGPIRAGGIRYVLKYMDKQQFGNYRHAQYTDWGREIPKMSFSKGIGKDFFISQIDNINKYGMAKVGNRLIPIPSYWKNRLMNFCEENIFGQREIHNKYAKQLEVDAKALGYDSYDAYLRQARKLLEQAAEKRKLRQGIPPMWKSKEIDNKPLPIGHEFSTDYVREVWREKNG